MPEAWRTVRVFISSTFRDMQAERDHLVRFVFPRLREELLKRRIHLIDVDLRWGVTSEQDALEVCREIIDECRPRFICILGGRYGWVPPGKEHSITADEVRYGVLARLGVKEYRYFYFRDPQASESIPEEVARAGGYIETEPANAQKLADLKQAVRDAGFEPFVYHAQWDEASQRLAGLEELGNRVYSDLLASIDDEFGTETPEALDEFAEEDAAMEAFIEERVQRYIVGSRRPLFRELTAFAQREGEPNIVALTGPSGCGKSALLGRFSQDYAREHPDDLVITHFAGASAVSTDLRRLLRRLCHGLVSASGHQEEVAHDTQELITGLPVLLRQVAASRRIVIVIDALDEVEADDNGQAGDWLPQTLPAGVRLVTSCAHLASSALGRRDRDVREITLAPLTECDARLIIEAFGQRYRKQMTDDQIGLLLAKREYGMPLYLLAALEELRTLGTHDEITERIRALPGETGALFGWVLDRLERDPGFRDAEGRLIGGTLVADFASCLAASRQGLLQVELNELVAPGDAEAAPSARADAQGNVAALVRLLRPYLTERAGLVSFSHVDLRRGAAERYLRTEYQRLAAHRRLADYLWRFRASARTALELPWQLQHTCDRERLATYLSDLQVLSWFVTHGKERELWAYWRAVGPEDDVAAAYLRAAERYERAGVLDDSLVGLLGKVSGFLITIGRYQEAVALCRRIAASQITTPGPPRPGVAASLHNLGSALLQLGQHREAEVLLRRALQLFEATEGSDPSTIARAMENLAWARRLAGDYESAAQLCRRGLAIHEQLRGPEHRDTAKSLNNLGVALLAQGGYAEAESVLRRALRIRERVWGLCHPETAVALANLSAALDKQGKASEARAHGRRAVAIFEESLGRDHPTTRQIRDFLAGLEAS